MANTRKRRRTEAETISTDSHPGDLEIPSSCIEAGGDGAGGRAASNSVPKTDRATPTAKNSNTEESPLTRLNELLTAAIAAAASINGPRKSDPALIEAHRLAKALVKSIPRGQADWDPLGYERHRASLEKRLKALETHCNNNPIDENGEQKDMMWNIAKEVYRWFGSIWRSIMRDMDDDGIDFVLPAMSLCSDTINRVLEYKSITDFAEFEMDFKIRGHGGWVVYQEWEHVSDALIWMWRELLVYSASSNIPTDAILAAVHRLGISNQVLELLQQSAENLDKERTLERNRHLWDRHWNDKMIGHIPHLCLQLSNTITTTT